MGDATDGQTPPTSHEPPAGASLEGVWESGPRRIEYTARAEWLLLRKKEKPAAEVFMVSYVSRDAAADRPVTFVFNGGPGAASAYLHLGAVGPTRVAFPPDGSLPPMPPRLEPNESSWLAFTDLVFVDPVGTGFSRIVDAGPSAEGKDKDPDAVDPKEYYAPKRDLESLCEALGRWLSSHHRWGSPVVIAGESYGGYRAARLTRMLQETAGIGLSGAVLISPALEIASLQPTDYVVEGWIDALPTMALAAVHHGRSRAFDADAPAETVREASEAFATGEYAAFLARGAAADDEARGRVLDRLADLTGLDRGLVERAGGRIPFRTFARELLRDEQKVVGFYDATVTADDPFPDRDPFAGPDPTLAGQVAAYTTGINRLLRSEIGVETDREYALLSYDVFNAWRDDSDPHAFELPPGATDDLRYGLRLNPHLRVFVTHGRYDLVTPYFASDRLLGLMRLDRDAAARVTVNHFDGGHMFYAWEESRHAFAEAIERFFETFG
jgi:carboxypeptidase C (cathepsin A)